MMKGTRIRGKTKPAKAFSFPAVHPVKTPIYVAAIGLVSVYSWGFFTSFPWQFAIAFTALAVMVECLKPVLGELIREARWPMSGLLWAAVAACCIFGSFGGVVAIEAANAPHVAYAKAQKDYADARATLASLQADLVALPSPTADMPASRVDAMRAANREKEARLLPMIEAAKVGVEAAEAEAAKHPYPGPGLPHLELWQKALVTLAIDFIIFGVPFASYKRPVVETVIVPAQDITPPKPIKKAEVVPFGKNDGGWGTPENPGPRRIAAMVKARRRAMKAV